MHTKISDEYVIKKRGLRGLLSYVSSWCILYYTNVLWWYIYDLSSIAVSRT